MSARGTVGGILASGAILALGWGVGSAALPAVTSSTTTSSGTTSSSGTSSSGASSSGTTSSGTTTSTGTTTSGSSGATDGTYTGDSVSTRFGNVQVQIVVSGGTITDVVAVHLTDQDQRSVSISNRAAPILRQEVLASQSANVSMVSGATYTSRAYLQSLQSALDQAGL